MDRTDTGSVADIITLNIKQSPKVIGKNIPVIQYKNKRRQCEIIAKHVPNSAKSKMHPIFLKK